MFRRLIALNDRYAATHLVLSGAPAELRNTDGETIGYVERVTVDQGRLRVSGWARAARITLVLGGNRAEITPRLRREDVGASLGIPSEVGFDLDLPCTLDTLATCDAPGLLATPVPGGSEIYPLSLPLPAPGPARIKLFLRFLWVGFCLLPAVAGWFITRDPAYRAKVKRGLGLNTLHMAVPLESRLFLTGDANIDRIEPLAPCRITIVLPVYNALDLLKLALTRIEEHTDLPWRLILIEDRSSDAAVRPFLRDWVESRQNSHDIELIENPENLGFIRSVNTGLAAAAAQPVPVDDTPEGPVILLNSDALVPAGWASRLVRPMLQHENVASVTPMSNDAEIFSSPAICARTLLTPGQGDAMDAVARTFHPEALLTPAPTGVGFCMALSRDWLARAGALDPAFGRGYGEEVDWCQKVRALGGRHLGLAGLFVEHRGGESFGSTEKLVLVARNNDIIARRYPGYDLEIQDFIAADPMVTARLALGMAWAGSLGAQGAVPAPVPVYLAHSLGGGAENWLQERIAGDLETLGAAVVLRVGGSRRWQIELCAPSGITRGSSDDTAFVLRLLALLPRRRIVYSCGVGDPDPMSLPDILLSLRGHPDDRIEVLFHDFFPLSPSYTLLDFDGVYRGPVRRGRDDQAHRSAHPDGTPATLADWQDAWAPLVRAAEVLTVFSADSAAQVRAVWPALSRRIAIRPHALPQTLPVIAPPAPGAAPVIGVLGNIGRQKGAAVLQTLARRLESGAAQDRTSGDQNAPAQDRPSRNKPAGLVLIGNIDPAYTLPKSVLVHGDYIPADIPELAARHGITHWLIPSIWPETFSYTTRETLATGLPVLAFDIGAQGEAVRAAPNGVPVPLRSTGPGEDAVGFAAAAILAALNGLSDRAAPASPAEKEPS